MTGGLWTPEERRWHINALELLAGSCIKKIVRQLAFSGMGQSIGMIVREPALSRMGQSIRMTVRKLTLS